MSHVAAVAPAVAHVSAATPPAVAAPPAARPKTAPIALRAASLPIAAIMVELPAANPAEDAAAKAIQATQTKGAGAASPKLPAFRPYKARFNPKARNNSKTKRAGGESDDAGGVDTVDESAGLEEHNSGMMVDVYA